MQGTYLIDISRLTSRTLRARIPTGIDRVCLAYIDRYGGRSQAVLQWRGWRRILSYSTSQELFTLLRTPDANFARHFTRVLTHALFSRWPSQDARRRIYFNPGHSGLQHPGLQHWLRRIAPRPIFMVHDLIPMTHPEYCRAGETARHVARMELMLKMGTGLLTNSQATREEVEAFARTHGLPLPPTVAAPLAGSALALDRSQGSPLAHPYFVAVGTIEPRKNHLLLLHVWRRLVAELGEQAPHLVVIGQRGWECENVVDLLERCESLHGVVHSMRGCSDAELARYLAHASALLFPSFAEGYGLPLVEALTLGTPVIASPLSAFDEVAGAVPEYLDPLDGPAWAQAVRDYASAGHPRRVAQMQRVRGFRVPTWDDHFQRVDALLEQLA